MTLLSPPEVRRRWGGLDGRRFVSPATFGRIVRRFARGKLKPASYGGRNGFAPMFTPRQADLLWKKCNEAKARSFRAMGKKIAQNWQTRWKHRRAGGTVKIVSLAELKARRAGK